MGLHNMMIPFGSVFFETFSSGSSFTNLALAVDTQSPTQKHIRVHKKNETNLLRSTITLLINATRQSMRLIVTLMSLLLLLLCYNQYKQNKCSQCELALLPVHTYCIIPSLFHYLSMYTIHSYHQYVLHIIFLDIIFAHSSPAQKTQDDNFMNRDITA